MAIERKAAIHSSMFHAKALIPDGKVWSAWGTHSLHTNLWLISCLSKILCEANFCTDFATSLLCYQCSSQKSPANFASRQNAVDSMHS